MHTQNVIFVKFFLGITGEHPLYLRTLGNSATADTFSICRKTSFSVAHNIISLCVNYDLYGAG